MGADAIDVLRREHEDLEAELEALEALRADKTELKRLQGEVDEYRCKPFGGCDDDTQEIFLAMQSEIVELRGRCDGYHLAFQEAQRKLNRLRSLYMEKVIPKLQDHNALTGTQSPPQKAGRPSQSPVQRTRKSMTTTTPVTRKVKQPIHH
eukprot:TRINITY_DN2512_c1_g1_i1.p1 TRINITY_DN2512_c1_g1~~TRINITY_DN2512_c1_g1_i1.p1  ORF type:complete len:150 (+),score=25.01 TRINITY_DN2512_c1_g1_i1:42-491(+)